MIRMLDVEVVVSLVKKWGWIFVKLFVLVVVSEEFGEFVVKRGRGWFKGLKLMKKKEVVFKFIGLKWFWGCLKGLVKKKLEVNDKLVILKKSLKKVSEWWKFFCFILNDYSCCIREDKIWKLLFYIFIYISFVYGIFYIGYICI